MRALSPLFQPSGSLRLTCACRQRLPSPDSAETPFRTGSHSSCCGSPESHSMSGLSRKPAEAVRTAFQISMAEHTCITPALNAVPFPGHTVDR